MEIAQLFEFMELVGRLKHMKRTGWVRQGIDDAETIAGHMYRMAVLALLVDTKENINKTKVMEMALVHDLAEAIVGDITPHCGVSVEEKHRREDEAMIEISKLLGDKGPDTLRLFREYESRESPEAKYVKDLDRLDLIMQAYEYEKRDQTHGKLEEFFTGTTEHISHPLLKKMANEIMTRRAELIVPPTVEH
ncbi:HD domain-containing protein 2 isoform X1 [Diachasma alloeum]|uniref:HD domain-containing protein 2 isoform X1 n=2 Tax=Diachasma alloeum TaxID=454923 RepID=UPI00073810BF|nr:HD domain-containing protein 2 isoform X1 [Diachasma alloeum]XP_015118718.1 HD domain-containing protein 2 isoform X1 [Diachasma alloeum]